MYKITKITDRDGNDRLDGRYPIRIGCIGDVGFLKKGYPLLFEYSLDAKGNEKTGTLKTSAVVRIEIEARHSVLTTLNSVYTLQYLGE